jgi:hypothetical protein
MRIHPSLAALTTLGAALAAAPGGCGTPRGRAGTPFVTFTFDDAAAAADHLDVQVGVRGVHVDASKSHSPGARRSSTDIDFTRYPLGQTVTLDVSATGPGGLIASGHAVIAVALERPPVIS